MYLTGNETPGPVGWQEMLRRDQHKRVKARLTAERRKRFNEASKIAKANPSPHFRFRFRDGADPARTAKAATELQKLGVDGSQLEWEDPHV